MRLTTSPPPRLAKKPIKIYATEVFKDPFRDPEAVAEAVVGCESEKQFF